MERTCQLYYGVEVYSTVSDHKICISKFQAYHAHIRLLQLTNRNYRSRYPDYGGRWPLVLCSESNYVTTSFNVCVYGYLPLPAIQTQSAIHTLYSKGFLYVLCVCVSVRVCLFSMCSKQIVSSTI